MEQVTYLFTDIEDSTRLWSDHPEAMGPSLHRHLEILTEAVEDAGGLVDKDTGDGIMAVLPTAGAAITAAVAGQRALASQDWGPLELRVRMGMHTGTGDAGGAEHRGPSVNRAARIMSLAHGGQVLVSEATRVVAREDLPDAVGFIDLGTHNLKGISGAERIFQVTHPDLRGTFPPPRSAQKTPHNLPSGLSSFVGREKDIGAIQQQVVHSRLVTLVGVGGVGKTRIAIEVARRLLGAFPDGVWFVDLAPVSDADLVVPVVARTMGVVEQDGRAAMDMIIEVLSDRTCLIVLDNCEHLVGEVAQVASSLLAGLPDLHLLATSREGLQVAGEVLWSVTSMDVPDWDEAVTAAQLVSSEGVTLFVERARDVDPDFELTEENASTVLHITRRVDGIPLAIELAAARLRALDLGQIAERLDDSFRLLAGGPRTALPRQRTLEATLEWSHDLLDTMERTLFRRLAVFTGSFLLASCEAVCADDELPRAEVVDLVDQLVDKSLLEVDRTGQPYLYRMLATVRDYALTKTSAAGELDVVRDRHARHYAASAAAARPHLRGPDQRRWLDRIEVEYGNYQAAFDWAVAKGDASTAADMVRSLARVWQKRARPRDAVRAVLGAYTLVGSDPQADLELAVWLALHMLLLEPSEIPAGFSVEEVAERARRHGDDRQRGLALAALGNHLAEGDDVERAINLFTEAIRTLRRAGDVEDALDVFLWLAQTHRAAGDYDRSREVLDEALELAEAVGEISSVAWMRLQLAFLDRNEGDIESSAAGHRSAEASFRDVGDRFGLAFTRGSAGVVALIREDLDTAKALFEEGYHEQRRMGFRSNAEEAAAFRARVARLEGDVDGARRWLSITATSRSAFVRNLALDEGAALAAARGETEEAIRLFGLVNRENSRHGIARPPYWTEDLDATVEQLRDQVGGDLFDVLFEEGERADPDEALARLVQPTN